MLLASQDFSRRSSGVEQLIRNQQVAGSNPIAGSSFTDLGILNVRMAYIRNAIDLMDPADPGPSLLLPFGMV